MIKDERALTLSYTSVLWVQSYIIVYSYKVAPPFYYILYAYVHLVHAVSNAYLDGR